MGSVDCLALLIGHGADVGAVTEVKCTSMNGSPCINKLLLLADGPVPKAAAYPHPPLPYPLAIRLTLNPQGPTQTDWMVPP